MPIGRFGYAIEELSDVERDERDGCWGGVAPRSQGGAEFIMCLRQRGII
jgi:hypothetical protein